MTLTDKQLIKDEVTKYIEYIRKLARVGFYGALPSVALQRVINSAPIVELSLNYKTIVRYSECLAFLNDSETIANMLDSVSSLPEETQLLFCLMYYKNTMTSPSSRNQIDLLIRGMCSD